MTQEDKDLLLKDITARLSYGVKIKRSNCPINLSVNGILGEYVHHIPYYVGGNIEINTTKIDEVKPYLRPMSSMTEEEKDELRKIITEEVSDFGKFIKEGHGLGIDETYMFWKEKNQIGLMRITLTTGD
jgi:hypothetical protein